jgi:hypothetical protein
VGVHVLNHGLQLGGGAVLLTAAANTFHTSATNAGTWRVFIPCFSLDLWSRIFLNWPRLFILFRILHVYALVSFEDE